ncbi:MULTISPECIES: hypothetical protein [Methylorubrum]|uniref:hypothetical protein n=1 Tax=Methylorubrum TaxID=2282523 RepID=UPI00209E6B9A|nr:MULTISPECIES: hypothetical protein [Methylorubrum]MCP1546989.1 hypothetical protein [Methylorubrum zatmanii]MCP1551732.1 hypothetical protein [Methylorubrum extorquens]MCP1577292.1 hypothetical protein [Methylorubrum extorquens]
MSTPIPMPDLGNDNYLRFTSGDVITLQNTVHGQNNYQISEQSTFLEKAKSLLDKNDPRFIGLALLHGLKRSDGTYVRNSTTNTVNLDDIPVPLSAVTARIYQGLQQTITG